MTPKRILTPAELATICEMQDQGIGLARIARQLKCGVDVLKRELNQIGRPVYLAKGGPDSSMDPVIDVKIGRISRKHPLYEVDQAMVRARTQRVSYGGWRQSSLADV